MARSRVKAKVKDKEYLSFCKIYDPELLEIANKLAKLEHRTPHDSIRWLILEAGRSKITLIQAQSKLKE